MVSEKEILEFRMKLGSRKSSDRKIIYQQSSDQKADENLQENRVQEHKKKNNHSSEDEKQQWGDVRQALTTEYKRVLTAVAVDSGLLVFTKTLRNNKRQQKVSEKQDERNINKNDIILRKENTQNENLDKKRTKSFKYFINF